MLHYVKYTQYTLVLQLKNSL